MQSEESEVGRGAHFCVHCLCGLEKDFKDSQPWEVSEDFQCLLAREEGASGAKCIRPEDQSLPSVIGGF
jgi:hypothetical protein